MKLFALFILTAVLAAPLSAQAEPVKRRVCFSVQETREKIAANHLAEPFKMLKNAAARAGAEAIGGKLCTWNDDYVYEISLLRRDGHVIHIFMNASNGEIVGSRNEN